MANIALTDEQVINLFKQLSPERKRAILLELAEDAQSRRDERMKYAESQLKRLCKKKRTRLGLFKRRRERNFC